VFQKLRLLIMAMHYSDQFNFPNINSRCCVFFSKIKVVLPRLILICFINKTLSTYYYYNTRIMLLDNNNVSNFLILYHIFFFFIIYYEQLIILIMVFLGQAKNDLILCLIVFIFHKILFIL